MLSSVSPVITGADAASPQPTVPSSASMRTKTLSARRTSSPAMMTGLSIGRLTAIGSMVLIGTGASILQSRPPSREATAGVSMREPDYIFLMCAFSMMSLNKPISWVTRFQQASAPCARTRKPALCNLS